MADEVTLGNPPRTLTLSRPREVARGYWRMRVTLTTPELRVSRDVDEPHHLADYGLTPFFQELAKDWRGWDGQREWRSLEGEMRLSCTHDRVGHVTCSVTLGGDEYMQGDLRDWEATVAVSLDPGSLEAVLAEVEDLLTVSSD